MQERTPTPGQYRHGGRRTGKPKGQEPFPSVEAVCLGNERGTGRAESDTCPQEIYMRCGTGGKPKGQESFPSMGAMRLNKEVGT